MDMQRKQILLLTKQNYDLKNKIKSMVIIKDIIVNYKTPEFAEGFIKNCKLYIAPLENSVVLCKVDEETNVTILDCAEIGDAIWYEVSIPVEDRINSKGWVKYSDIIQSVNCIIPNTNLLK